MTQEDDKKRTNLYFIYGLVILLVAILVLSFIPSFTISISNAQLVLILIIVALLLFRYFDVIEIPGFLKMSKKIEELKNETKEIRQAQMNIMQAIAVTQNTTATSSVQIINQATTDARQEAETLLPDLPAMSQANLSSSTATQMASQQIREHVQRRNYAAAFLDLRRIIDGQLSEILGTEQKHMNVYGILRDAKKSEILSEPLLESILSVRKYANVVIHMTPAEERNISPAEVEDIVNLGIRTIYELEKTKNAQTGQSHLS